MASVLTLAILFCGITATVAATCGGQMPNQPTPGESLVVPILVDDPSLGEVERTFRLYIPVTYINDVEIPLVMNFHARGATGTDWIGLHETSDQDPDGGYIVAHGNGMDGTWNCSRTDGPLGPPCVLPRPDGWLSTCGWYDSCTHECTAKNSCDWTSCYDDVAFVRAMVDYVKENYCVNVNSIHMTGFSNGGMFLYYAASRLNDIVASIGPMAGSPVMGFGDVPLDPPVSVIDYHGLLDTRIPYDVGSPSSMGEGPRESVITPWYSYVEQKPGTNDKWASELGCTDNNAYPTHMDGVDGWACDTWTGCLGGTELVHCTGDYYHQVPFGDEDPPHIDGTKIMWDFMKRQNRSHKK